MAKLTDIEGVGESYAKKLRQAGIVTTGVLLKKGATPAGRKKIAETAGVSEKRVLEWVNRVDLFRIKGISEEFSDLLEEAGVDTVPELARRNAKNLTEMMIAVNNKRKLVRRLPSEGMVVRWIEQAKKLPRILKY